MHLLRDRVMETAAKLRAKGDEGLAEDLEDELFRAEQAMTTARDDETKADLEIAYAERARTKAREAEAKTNVDLHRRKANSRVWIQVH